MMNISVNEHHAYIELEVFGAYSPERAIDVLNAMRGLVERHGGFSQLEVHHGKVDNIFSAMRGLSGADPDADYSFINKMRKYALVSDNPSWIMRLMIFASRFGTVKMKLFPIHERDHARRWIEEPEHDARVVDAPVV